MTWVSFFTNGRFLFVISQFLCKFGFSLLFLYFYASCIIIITVCKIESTNIKALTYICKKMNYDKMCNYR